MNNLINKIQSQLGKIGTRENVFDMLTAEELKVIFINKEINPNNGLALEDEFLNCNGQLLEQMTDSKNCDTDYFHELLLDHLEDMDNSEIIKTYTEHINAIEGGEVLSDKMFDFVNKETTQETLEAYNLYREVEAALDADVMKAIEKYQDKALNLME